MSHPNQLGIPADVLADGTARELGRLWISNERNVYVLDVRDTAEPALWGILALDVMKHAARAYQAHTGQPKEEAYKRILAGFMAEMQDPTEPL